MFPNLSIYKLQPLFGLAKNNILIDIKILIQKYGLSQNVELKNKNEFWKNEIK